MSVDLKVILAKYVISVEKYPHMPRSLDGEIVLEEHRSETGELRGVYTVSIETLTRILEMTADPSKRPIGMENLSPSEFEQAIGYKRWLDRWRNEGIRI